LSGKRRYCAFLHQNVFLTCEGYENASCGLSVDITDQGGLASANGRFLFRAVATPFHCELIGVSHSVELAREA